MAWRYDYRWAINHNVALGSLVNVEEDLFPYTKPKRIAPKTLPVNEFPVRDRVQAGYELGDGFIDHDWTMVLPETAVEYVVETKFVLTTVTYKAVTIYTRRHHRRDYARYNAYITLPVPGRDLEPLPNGLFRVVWRFTDLRAL